MSLLAILLFAGTVGLSLWATMRVRQVYSEFSQLPASSGLTGAETAAKILRQEGIHDVQIVELEQALGDHYDPIHKRDYAPLQWRMASVGLTTFASQVVLWLPLLGIFTGFVNTAMALILVATAWGILMLFNLITLPVEFDASSRARLVLRDTGLIRTPEEDNAVTQLLRAAAWTYVAAFITSLAYFLLHLLPLLSGRKE
ncbi:MAG TPA: zinc metallopeptidase [Chthoniobacterales bacterium]|nr:zinc metallopeptidase [Chthoniobacterales bacterium]